MTVPTQPCPATKRNGEICNSTRISQSGFCFAHDPEAIEWRRMGGMVGASRGKRKNVNKVKDARLDAIVASLQETLNELSSQSPTANTTYAMARLADTISEIIYRTAEDLDDENSPVLPPDGADI